MPIYEYRCAACGHELEKLQKLSDEPLKVCPACGQSALAKKVSAAGFRLKGGGWYETDFKGKKQKNLAKGDTGEKAEKSDKPAADSGTPKSTADKKSSGGET